jgi:hypothetical protein
MRTWLKMYGVAVLSLAIAMIGAIGAANDVMHGSSWPISRIATSLGFLCLAYVWFAVAKSTTNKKMGGR